MAQVRNLAALNLFAAGGGRWTRFALVRWATIAAVTSFERLMAH
jgi:hypothetical protein